MCTDAAYFLSPAPQPAPIESELVFHGVELRGTAEAVLHRLAAAEMGPVDLLADHELFTIVYGRSLVLEFLPNELDARVSPSRSRLASVQFNFGPVYGGRSPVELAVG